MKRILTILFVLAAAAVSAQSLQLKYNGQILNNNDTIGIVVTDAKATNNLYVEYANVGAEDVYFKVKKEELSLVEGASTTFCIAGTCYPGTVSQEIFMYEGDAVTLEDEENVFHATYSYTQTGTSIVKYTFYNTEADNDAISFYIVYSAGVGLNNVSAANALKAYPNPAINSVNIDYSTSCTNAQLVIKNLAGAVVYKTKVQGSGRLNVNLADFKAGVYIYGLECDGRMQQTKKLVVK